MNGGYILLDLSNYDLSQSLDTDHLDEANELTKDEYDKLISLFKYSQKSGKPILVKTGLLYDGNENLTFYIRNYTFGTFTGNEALIFTYTKSTDNDTNVYVALFKYSDGKYYLMVTDEYLL